SFRRPWRGDQRSASPRCRPASEQPGSAMMDDMTSTPPALDVALLQRFADIVGPGYALTSETDLAPYVSERRGLWHGTTPLVLRPGSVEEVSAILKLATETGTAIIPQGGNTGLVGGQVPDKSG